MVATAEILLEGKPVAEREGDLKAKLEATQ